MGDPVIFRYTNSMKIQRIAVIGSGISGMSAAYLLSQKYDITLFEANHRLGGHTNTVKTNDGQAIDTGFIVFNEKNYPYFCKFLDQLNVASHASDMSFAYLNQASGYAYSSDVPYGLFSTKSNMISPAFYGFIYNILRFNKMAKHAISTVSATESIDGFLKRHRFNDKFCNEYVLPMGAAIWSTSQNDIRHFPAKLFLSFWDNHGLLQVRNRPQWRTVTGGSQQYIHAVIKKTNLNYHTNTPIHRIERTDNNVTLFGPKTPQIFDAVVIATHANQAYNMLAQPSSLENRLLGPWNYSKNTTILHTSPIVAPKQRSAWASWIYTRHNDNKMSASYYMNRLQNIQSQKDYFVTLNASKSIPSDAIQYETNYEHPIMTTASVNTQTMLSELNGHQNTYYCGSYFGNGFHEDGIVSSIAIGRQLGCEL